MLICHPYEFIFIKPVKAAGTSVECFLEPLCHDQNEEIHEYGPEKIYANGIVGYRGPSKGDATYWNHMPSSQIQCLHPDLFKSYHKISIVRDPYQKAISLFLWLGPLTYVQAQEMAVSEPGRLHALFLLFLRSQPGIWALLTDYPRLLIQNKLIIDYILRYEQLSSDLSDLVKHLCLPLSLSELGYFKSSGRGNESHKLQQYFSGEALGLVNRVFELYFDLFGYYKYEHISDLLISSNRITRFSVP